MKTFCPECGPLVGVDDDGLCLNCGATALGKHTTEAADAFAEIARLKEAVLNAALASFKEGEKEIDQLNRLVRSQATVLDSTAAENEVLKKALEKIADWGKAYPLDVFPEPDMKKAREGLQSVGITLDAVSASNMRHVVKTVSDIAEKALRGTKERA